MIGLACAAMGVFWFCMAGGAHRDGDHADFRACMVIGNVWLVGGFIA